MFGPKFESRVGESCGWLSIISEIEEACETMVEWGYELNAIPTKLLEHFAQNFLAGRFQEYSECWGLL